MILGKYGSRNFPTQNFFPPRNFPTRALDFPTRRFPANGSFPPGDFPPMEVSHPEFSHPNFFPTPEYSHPGSKFSPPGDLALVFEIFNFLCPVNNFVRPKLASRASDSLLLGQSSPCTFCGIDVHLCTFCPIHILLGAQKLGAPYARFASFGFFIIRSIYPVHILRFKRSLAYILPYNSKTKTDIEKNSGVKSVLFLIFH